MSESEHAQSVAWVYETGPRMWLDQSFDSSRVTGMRKLSVVDENGRPYRLCRKYPSGFPFTIGRDEVVRLASALISILIEE